MSTLNEQLAQGVLDMDEVLVTELAQKLVAEGGDALDAITNGLAKGMEQAGDLFDKEEYFVPELLLCADALYAGIEILRKHIPVNLSQKSHKILLGVIQGDTHDIGKNLVKLMLETAGFDVVDLGRDITPQTFVEKAKEVKAEVIGLSSLMTTTMDGMDMVIKILKEEGIRDQYKVIVGGGPISQNFADQIGADGYSRNATEAVKLVRRLVETAS
jgi:dimethylamine corrinoid protein